MNLGVGRARIAKLAPAAGKKNVNTDAKLELGEFYRDICACCLEKDACRKSGMIQCDAAALSA